MATAVPSTPQETTVAPESPQTAVPAGQAAPPAPLLTPEQVMAAAGAFAAWLARPRVRVTVIGALLLLIGALVMTSSVWTLPLVLVGALMVVIAWIGRRLDGRFAVDWGETGTQLEFRAEIKAARLSPAPVGPVRAVRTSSPVARHELEAAPPEAEAEAQVARSLMSAPLSRGGTMTGCERGGSSALRSAP